MPISPLKVLLFVAGALIAGFGAAYYAGVFEPPAREIAGTAVPVTGPVDASKPEEDGAAASRQGEEVAAADEKSAEVGQAAEEEIVAPAFDLLRVEPDGSMVVAGRADPGADVEVLSGSSVLAGARAGISGDFAAVLDEPLKPGEYNIVLRSTSPEKVVTSVETAIVSIPSDESGQVVALVQEPGEPSRLITVPEPAPKREAPQKDEAAEEAVAVAPAEEPAAGEAGSEAVQPQGTTEAEPAQAAAAPQEEPAAVSEAEGEPGTGTPPAEMSASATNGGVDAAEEDQTVKGAAREDLVAEARPGEEAAGEEGTGQEIAKAQPEKEQEAASKTLEPAQAEEGASPFIEAVEIDGREVFVAGRAEPGRQVRIYVNEILLGEATVGPEGRFLVQTERDLPVGDYIIRVDVLGDDGVTVIARAAVPFQRQSGERVTSVAAEPAQPKAAGETPESSDTTAEKADRPVGAAPGADGDAASAQDTALSGGTAGKTVEVGRAPGAAEGEGDMASRQAAPSVEDVQMAPPLEPVDGAVIIRRGDTLWHISRRVYGHGVRYTTIYLANQDQIRDPDLIWPGQIFTLPEKTEEGEKADLSAIGDQAVAPQGNPVEAAQ